MSNIKHIMAIEELCQECFQISFDNGFWDNKDPNDVGVKLEKLMLIVTEVAEAAEAVREGDDENFNEELADILIRVFDLAGAHNINLGHAVVDKIEKNKQRPYKHGKLA